MNTIVFWEVFENTGSIEAFLTYSKSEEISSDIYGVASNTYDAQKDQKTKEVKRKRVRSNPFSER